jgi:hypothetical protein
MKYTSKEKKIIDMCRHHENTTTDREVDRQYYLQFWDDQIQFRRYFGRQGLKTIIDSYCDDNDITRKKYYYEKYIGKGICKELGC